MSTPATETKPAEVPKAEEKQETTTTSTDGKEKATTEPSVGAESSAMEVDASQTEVKTEAASGEAKPEGEAAKAKTDGRIRLNGSARKRFRWLLDQGYAKEEAAELAKEPLKTKELRDRFNADTKKGKKPMDEKVIEAEVKKLNPADKKRFAWLLQNGHTEEEALEVIKKKRTNAGPVKRNLPTNGGPPNKTSKPSTDAPAGIAMAVAAKDYPNKLLTNAQSNEVKAAILKEVVQQKDSETKPRFESCNHVKAGYLRVICSDAPTRQWLHRIVGKLSVPEGVSLKLVVEKKLVKSDIYFGVFSDSKKEENASILEFIKSQNDGLDTSKWKILSRKDGPTKQSIELMFSVDSESSKSIAKLDNALKYKFNKVVLRKQHNPNDNQPSKANQKPVGRTGRVMGPPQRRSLNPPRPSNTNSFVSVWDSNVAQKRSFNQMNNSFPNSNSVGRNNWDNGLNSFGLGNIGLDNTSFRSNNSFEGNNMFGGNDSYRRSNSFETSSNSFGRSNSYGGSNSFGDFGNSGSSYGSQGNSFGRGGSGGGNQSSSNRSISLSNSLYDQLKLIGSSVGNGGNNFGGSTRRTGVNGPSRRIGGGGGGGNNLTWSRSSGGNSNSGRSDSLGNRSFFTTTRTGFF